MKNLPFGFDAPEDSPGFLLWQTTISWQRLIKKALEPHDISHAQFVILAILLWLYGKKREVNQIDIIEMSKLDKMTVSKSLKKLVGMKLVSRHENQEDNRAKLVKLTKLGMNLAYKLIPVVENVDAQFFSKLPKKEEKDLIRILQKLVLSEYEWKDKA